MELADGRDFSVEAARAGMARSYVYDDKPVSRYPEIRAAEEEARVADPGAVPSVAQLVKMMDRDASLEELQKYLDEENMRKVLY